MDCLGESISSETSVFLGFEGHQRGIMGVEEAFKIKDVGKNNSAYENS